MSKTPLPPAEALMTHGGHLSTFATVEVETKGVWVNLTLTPKKGAPVSLLLLPAEALTLASDIENRVQEVTKPLREIGGAA